MASKWIDDVHRESLDTARVLLGTFPELAHTYPKIKHQTSHWRILDLHRPAVKSSVYKHSDISVALSECMRTAQDLFAMLHVAERLLPLGLQSAHLQQACANLTNVPTPLYPAAAENVSNAIRDVMRWRKATSRFTECAAASAILKGAKRALERISVNGSSATTECNRHSARKTA